MRILQITEAWRKVNLKIMSCYLWLVGSVVKMFDCHKRDQPMESFWFFWDWSERINLGQLKYFSEMIRLLAWDTLICTHSPVSHFDCEYLTKRRTQSQSGDFTGECHRFHLCDGGTSECVQKRDLRGEERGEGLGLIHMRKSGRESEKVQRKKDKNQRKCAFAFDHC